MSQWDCHKIIICMADVVEGHMTSKAAGYYHCFIIYQNHFTSKRPGSVYSCSLPTPCLASQRPPANHTACQPGKGNHTQVGQSPQGRAFFFSLLFSSLSRWPENERSEVSISQGYFEKTEKFMEDQWVSQFSEMKGSQETALGSINKKLHTF